MDVQTFANLKGAAKAAAEVIGNQLRKKPDSVLGLGVGETLLPIYQRLVQMNMNMEAPFNKLRSFQVNEFLGIPGAHPMSNRFFLVDNFLDHIPALRRFQKRLAGLPVNMEHSCGDFERRIKRMGGIDILILDLGPGGWIGFNEKGSSFDSVTREVALSDELRSHYASNFAKGFSPGRGLTMGIKTMLKAKQIILLTSGQDMESALANMITGKISPEVPSTALRKHPNVVVFADNAAALGLPSSFKRTAA